MKQSYITKILPCVLTGLLAAGTSAFAAPADQVIDAPELGFHFTLPETYLPENLKGFIDWNYDMPATGVLRITSIYYAVSPDRLDEYVAYMQDTFDDSDSEQEPADPNWLSGYEYARLFDVFFLNENRTEDDLRQILKTGNGIHEDKFSWLEEIGTDGDTTFYLGQYTELEDNKELFQEHMGDFYSEFESLCADKDSFLAGLTLTAPQWPHTTGTGDVLSFETTDLDGNALTSEEIFGGSKVTMLNVWATWCGPCVAELPELEKLAEEFEAKDCQIVGICFDSAEEGAIDSAKAILADAGVTYLNIAAPENAESIIGIEAYPTSFFVDSTGKVLTDPVVGAMPAEYPVVLDEALELAG